jgi:hypothetical protein
MNLYGHLKVVLKSTKLSALDSWVNRIPRTLRRSKPEYAGKISPRCEALALNVTMVRIFQLAIPWRELPQTSSV